MSNIDKTNLMFKTILSILGFALMVIFYQIWNGLNDVTRITNSLDGRLIKIETKLDDEISNMSKEDARRDKAIEELYQMVNQKGSK